MCSFTQKKERGIHHQKDEKGKDSFTPMTNEGQKGKRGLLRQWDAPADRRARSRSCGPRPPAPGQLSGRAGGRAPGSVPAHRGCCRRIE